MQEYLSGVKTEDEEMSAGRRCGLIMLRLGTNLAILTSIAGAGYLIYYVSDTLSTDVRFSRE